MWTKILGNKYVNGVKLSLYLKREKGEVGILVWTED